MIFEDIIEEIGGFGSFQFRIFLVISLFEFPASWSILLPVFISAHNQIVCPSENTGDVCHNGIACTNFTYASDVKTSIISEWDLTCDRSYIATLATTVQMAGLVVGALITGQLADQFGRKVTLYSVYTGMLVASLVSSLATTWQMYAVCRALVGVFFAGTMVVNFVMPMEFVGKRWRTFCGAIGFWAAGVMVLPLMSYYVTEWRYLTALTSVIGVLLLPTYWFIPESPRWLILKGRTEEAKSIILNIARINGKPAPNMEKLSMCIKAAEASGSSKQYSYWNLFRTPHGTRDVLILIFIWYVCGSVYYGSTMSVASLTGSAYMNMFYSGLAEIPALIFVLLINNRIGRRWTLFCLMTMSAVSYITIVTSIWTDDDSILIRVAALVGKTGITGAWVTTQIYSAELFPTVIRNLGIATCSMASRVGIITVPYMIEMGATWMFLWCGCLTFTAALLGFLLPETLNKSLPDVLPPLDWPCCRNTRRRQSQSQGHEKSDIECDLSVISSDDTHFRHSKVTIEQTIL